MTKATLYLTRISTEDGEDWDVFVVDTDSVENATVKLKKELADEYGHDEFDIELYPQPIIGHYRVELVDTRDEKEKPTCWKCHSERLAYRMHDTDGTNLEEAYTCLDCGAVNNDAI